MRSIFKRRRNRLFSLFVAHDVSRGRIDIGGKAILSLGVEAFRGFDFDSFGRGRI